MLFDETLSYISPLHKDLSTFNVKCQVYFTSNIRILTVMLAKKDMKFASDLLFICINNAIIILVIGHVVKF